MKTLTTFRASDLSYPVIFEMEYSNKNFDRFQDEISESLGREHFLYKLRDALFMNLAYGHNAWKSDLLLYLPFGAYLILGLDYLKGLRRRGETPELEAAEKHFLLLCCSERSNHMDRIFHFRDHLKQQGIPYQLWKVSLPDQSRIYDEVSANTVNISGQWTRWGLRPHFASARRDVSVLRGLFGKKFKARDYRRTFQYLVKYRAWTLFWEEQLFEHSPGVFCTFEKGDAIKPMFRVAEDKGLARRVHWVHGLRHHSLQATSASELWVLTDGDVEFFSGKVGRHCNVIQHNNPFADVLRERLGGWTRANSAARGTVRFLFLGPGGESSYTDSMRAADLAILRTAQEAMGSRVEWRFRPHPAVRKRFLRELKEAGLSVTDFSENELFDDIAWSDAVGSSWSSLLLDIYATGRPVFWVQASMRSLGGADELIKAGVGTWVHAENVVSELESVLQHNNAS